MQGQASDAFYCAGYVRGLLDMATYLSGVYGKSLYCLPSEGLKLRPLVEMFVGWLEAQESPHFHTTE